MTETTRHYAMDIGDGDNKDNESVHETRNPEHEIFFMGQALNVAKDALRIGEVPVGCVIVLRDATVINSSIPQDHNICNCTSYETSPSVIVSHGANQVNATRDATRHAEMVAIDRMLTRGRSSDQMKLPADIICNSMEEGETPLIDDSQERMKSNHDQWINIPQCKDHWKNSFGWGSGRVYDKDILSQCDLYVTCEPCIMVRI
jgi:tRNA(Arg) A34 adenosine deaminase TadA